MLSADENEILTRTGPDTPMGRMMRRFWLPICTSRQLPAPDCDPLRTKMLGEPLVAFRDSGGRVGVIDEFCVHRRASLALGRVEDGGIRCLLHGWKFAVDGTILETPNHKPDNVRTKIKQPAYPAIEAGGFVWTYMGPAEKKPPFQRYAFFDTPDENRVVLRINTAANYLQLYEGGTDSSHVPILHMNMMNPGWKRETFAKGSTGGEEGSLAVGESDGTISDPTAMYVSSAVFQTAPELSIEDTEYGYHYAAMRDGPKAEDGSETWSVRITPVMFPTGRLIPANAFGFYVFEIPQDDFVTSTYLVFDSPTPLDREEIIDTMGLADTGFWNDEDCNFRASWDDRLGQDRAAMRRNNWSGYGGIEQEDAIIALSMGAIVDRSKEYLVPSDEAVIRLRRRLLESVRRNEAGEDPIGLDIEDYSKVAAVADTVIAKGARWQDLAPDNLGLGSGDASEAAE